ncbi:MAG TPA: hypothetical protein VHX18_02575 [Rhizomicrobium sp.]|jgi:hypothetical protein|nr:hypothetical protein [Rhizomicrobium sp.]
MNGNIRKLALDFGFRWFWPLAILSALICDFGFLLRPQSSTAFSGMLLALQGTFSAPRVPLWRTLPVTDKEIGRARWWQMIGIPGLAILAIMALAMALYSLVTAMGWSRHAMLPDAPTLLEGMLGQFFYPVLLAIFMLVSTFARSARSPLAVAAMVLVGIMYLASFSSPHLLPYLSLQTHALWFGLASLLTAAILYVTAPKWPQPVIQPLQLDIGGNNSRAVMSDRAGQGGWTALCGMALLRPALMLAMLLVLWISMTLALKLDRIFVLQLRSFIPLVVILQATQLNATALRMLRALPGSTLRLTAYLFLLPLALVAVAICSFFLALEPWLTGEAPRIDMVVLSAVLFASALALPAALAARQVVMSLIVMLPLALVPLIEFGWNYVPSPWRDERLLAGLAAVAICAGFFWMHARISRGMRVYRFQPYIAPRWRGND